MSDIDETRKELDELRGRVIMLERQGELNTGDAAQALVIARAAERTASRCQLDIRDGLARIGADMARIASLLTHPVED